VSSSFGKLIRVLIVGDVGFNAETYECDAGAREWSKNVRPSSRSKSFPGIIWW